MQDTKKNVVAIATSILGGFSFEVGALLANVVMKQEFVWLDWPSIVRTILTCALIFYFWLQSEKSIKKVDNKFSDLEKWMETDLDKLATMESLETDPERKKRMGWVLKMKISDEILDKEGSHRNPKETIWYYIDRRIREANAKS